MTDTSHRVLVVEDDAALRGLIAKHLRGQRFDVMVAGTAEEVLRAVRDGTLVYDVALTDVHLPGMSGVDLSRLLLASRPLCPLIVITGDDDAALARQALSHGAAGYLLKPFQLFELDAALSQAVSQLEMVETTEALARAQAAHLHDWGEAGGQLPRSWLHLGDGHSGADGGHGPRVVSVVGLLARATGEAFDAHDRDALRTAARTHEIGRLLGPAGRQEVARRSAQLLSDLGFHQDVAELVRQAAEPWSPGSWLGARVLALADQLDHEAARRVAAGQEDEEAIRAAVDWVVDSAGAHFDPVLVQRLIANREAVESMWVLQRQAVPAEPRSGEALQTSGGSGLRVRETAERMPIPSSTMRPTPIQTGGAPRR